MAVPTARPPLPRARRRPRSGAASAGRCQTAGRRAPTTGADPARRAAWDRERGRREGRGGGSQPIGIIKVQQAGAVGAGGEAGAGDGIEAGRLHAELLKQIAQGRLWAEQSLGGKSAKLGQQGGAAGGKAGAHALQHHVLRNPIEHQPAGGRQKRKPLPQQRFQLPPAVHRRQTAAQQGAALQIKTKAPVLLANAAYVLGRAR